MTLTVDIRESGYYGHGGPMSTLTMTIQDGKIVSYTNPYYNDVEALTEQWIAEQAQGMEDLGIPVEKAAVDIFRCDGYTEDGYTLWLVSWRFLPEDVDDPNLDRLTETNWVEEQGWRVQLGSPYTYLIFRSTADGGAELVEAVPDSEITFPFAAYVRYVMQEGLTFSKHGSYYPAADTAFLRSPGGGRGNLGHRLRGRWRSGLWPPRATPPPARLCWTRASLETGPPGSWSFSGWIRRRGQPSPCS